MFKLDCDLKRGLGGVLAVVERILRRNRPQRQDNAKANRKAATAPERKAPETEAEQAFYAAMGWQTGDWDNADWRDFTS